MPTSNINADHRSEQVGDIIARMPNKFGLYTTYVILFILICLLACGWFIKYPDTVTGNIVINARYSPIKLVANASGKITLLKFKPQDEINEGDEIAYIQTNASFEDLEKLSALLDKYNNSENGLNAPPSIFPNKLSLGEINVKYYTFLTALQGAYNYYHKNIFQKQEENYNNQIHELTDIAQNNARLEKTREKNMTLSKKIADRDSILLAQKVGIEDDADRTRIVFLNSKENYQNIHNEIKNNLEQIEDAENKLQQLSIQMNEKEKQVRLDLLSSYSDLKQSIDSWKQRYVFTSPINGNIEYLKFLSNNEFIQSGEDVFTIVPKKNKIIGQVQLPARGAGKVKLGQDVIIKLENYPYQEFGSVKGKVSSISLITNTAKLSNQSEVNYYLINVTLPRGLETNYGSQLDFKYEIKGMAEIISTHKRLIERFFDNLTTAINKN